MTSNPIFSSKAEIPVFILAGGLGTRISEETSLRPKPMIEIGEIPIILHIMRWYYKFGFSDFVICAGYKSWEIKNFFLNYDQRLNHLIIDHRRDSNLPGAAFGRNLNQEKWRVRIIDTGLETMTGARLARAIDVVSEEDKFDNFALTYGDGLADVNIDQELTFHLEHGKLGTVLGVPPAARFGELDVKPDGHVEGFLEKPESRQGLINGGFFFFKKAFRKYLSPEQACILERTPLERLSTDNQLMMFRHQGFWHAMDTLRDKNHLQSLWDSGKAPWQVETSR